MKGLIIKQPYVDAILRGKKTWELRGTRCKERGRIYIIAKGTRCIFGTAKVIDSIGPLSKSEFNRNRRKHRAKKPFSKRRYRKMYAWVLAKVRRFRRPKPYQHPRGAVIWVKDL